jgi:hypothetical protein
MIPYCGWNKNSSNIVDGVSDYDFMQINEVFSKKEEGKQQEDETEEIKVPPL